MSLTWVVKKIKGGQTRFDKPDDGRTPMSWRSERYVEISADYGPATPCDIHCLEAFVAELHSAIDYLKSSPGGADL
jgi:hypothetical protein